MVRVGSQAPAGTAGNKLAAATIAAPPNVRRWAKRLMDIPPEDTSAGYPAGIREAPRSHSILRRISVNEGRRRCESGYSAGLMARYGRIQTFGRYSNVAPPVPSPGW